MDLSAVTPEHLALAEAALAHRNAQCLTAYHGLRGCSSIFHTSDCWQAFWELPPPQVVFA